MKNFNKRFENEQGEWALTQASILLYPCQGRVASFTLAHASQAVKNKIKNYTKATVKLLLNSSIVSEYLNVFMARKQIN